MKFLLLLIVIFSVYQHHVIDGRIFGRCELALDIKRRNVSSGDIANLVCIAQFESNYNTQRVKRGRSDGSWDWGIFQINDRWWCNPGDGRPSRNGCNINCNQLLTDDIRTALICARTIRDQGLRNWPAINNNCSGGRAKSVSDCGV